MRFTEIALVRGIDGYLVVTSKRLLKCVVVNAGCEVTVLGPERPLGRLPALAGYIHVTGQTLKELRQRAGLAGPVLRPDVSVAA